MAAIIEFWLSVNTTRFSLSFQFSSRRLFFSMGKWKGTAGTPTGIFESETTVKTSVKAGSIILLYPGKWHRYKPDQDVGYASNKLLSVLFPNRSFHLSTAFSGSGNHA